MTSPPLLGIMRSVLALSFTDIPVWHPNSTLSMMLFMSKASPHRHSCNSINMVPITIWRCDANYIATTSRLLRKEAIFPATTHPHYNDSPSPRMGCQCSPPGDSFTPNYLIRIFSVVLKRWSATRGWDIFLFIVPPPCIIYDICSLGLWTEGCKAWVVFYLLMRVRVMCAHSAATQTKQKKPFKAPHTMDPSVWVPECKDFVSVLKLLTVVEKHVTRGCIPP